MTKIEKLIEQIKALVPEGWGVSEAFGLDMMGGSTPTFVMVSHPNKPRELAYPLPRNATPEKRAEIREAYKLWREEAAKAVSDRKRMLEASLKNVCISADVTRIYVYPRR